MSLILKLPYVNYDNESKRIYLYNEGDECIDITGGWASKTYYNRYDENNIMITEKRDNCLYLYGQTKTMVYQIFHTNNIIDLSNYSKVGIKCKFTTEYKTGYLCHVNLTDWYTSFNPHLNFDEITEKDKVLEIIRNKNTSPNVNNKHLGVMINNASDSINPRGLEVYKIWIE